VKQAVSWQTLTFNGLLHYGIIVVLLYFNNLSSFFVEHMILPESKFDY